MPCKNFTQVVELARTPVDHEYKARCVGHRSPSPSKFDPRPDDGAHKEPTVHMGEGPGATNDSLRWFTCYTLVPLPTSIRLQRQPGRRSVIIVDYPPYRVNSPAEPNEPPLGPSDTVFQGSLAFSEMSKKLCWQFPNSMPTYQPNTTLLNQYSQPLALSLNIALQPVKKVGESHVLR